MSVYTINEIKEKVVPLAQEYGIDEMYLFGSYARGSATDDSDIDFLIKGFNCQKSLAFPTLFADLEEKLQKKVDVVTAESLNNQIVESRFTRRFKYNLKNERVMIYEKR